MKKLMLISLALGLLLISNCNDDDPCLVPETPSITGTVAGDSEVEVNFTTSTEVDSYTVKSTPENLMGTGTSSPIVVNGLTPGTPYTFTVTALNDCGSSDPSSPSTPITPLCEPEPTIPVIDSVTAGDEQATIYFTPQGGETQFSVFSNPDSISATSSTSPITVAGLTNETSYTFRITSSNQCGTSNPSGSSQAVTPLCDPLALAPVIDSLVAGDAEATVYFTPQGGESDFTVTSNPDGVIGNGTNSPITVSGLTNGTTYTFTIVSSTTECGPSDPSTPSQEITPQEAALVAYFPFNGNAIDESIYSHDGTVSGASLTQDRNGNDSSAYSFDGSDFIEVEDASLINLGQGAGKEWSISVWYNKTTSTTDVELILGKGQTFSSSTTDYSIQFFSDEIHWITGSGTDTCSFLRVSQLSINNWHHIVVTLESSGLESGTKKIYIDGVLIAECDYTLKTAVRTDPLLIGARLMGIEDKFFTGAIDDIRIYNRLLSEPEITDLFNE